MAEGAELVRRHYPEASVGGFSRVNGSIEFYTRINALVNENSVVLDYGAGRGAQIDTERVPYVRHLKTLKGRVKHLEGCDIDETVMGNPFLNSAKVFQPEKPLPYGDNTFDVIYSSWVLEHVADPAQVARELLRVLKPGGYFCAITPNKFGYISLASRLAGNVNHTALLRKIQPERLEHDVFPTFYRMNTRGALSKAFTKADEVVVYDSSWEPAYHFNNALVFRAFKLLHGLTPPGLNAVLLVFVRK
ncbi:class I SAM-dependent methyltransferase [Citromicrobium bathyomarinum]|uniref:class I SAM-dependent methyltransferase n=1 Tax=Citromicrobium bathyomarinum TaxID=72174 RepID=UPI00315ABABD